MPSARWVWRGALAFFILSGLTGILFRLGVAQGTTFGLGLGNIRHAHSHTMYFGWVTPALMALIAYHLPSLGRDQRRKVGLAVGLAFVTALLASMIMAGFNVLAWYAYVVLYLRARSDGPSSIALRLFDLAVFFLVLATLGAWGLSVMQVLGIDELPLRVALTHVFLDIFSEGWFVLGVLGLAAATVRLDGAVAAWGVRLAAVGIPFTFALGMPPSLVSPLFQILASLGGLLAALGVMLIGGSLWSQFGRQAGEGHSPLLWRFALIALGLKALAEVAVSILPSADWVAIPYLRIIYLHVVLLGFVSVGLVAGARSVWGKADTRGQTAFVLSVAAVIVFLLPFSPIWPAEWRGTWIVWAAAITALGPVLVAIQMLVSSALKRSGSGN
jgi:hypothetical protein